MRTDIRGRLEQAREFTSETTAPVKWVVDGLIPERGITLLAAGYGMGKSWLGLHLAQSISRAHRTWLGLATTTGSVLHWDLESPVIRATDYIQGENLEQSKHHYWMTDSETFPELTNKDWQPKLESVVDELRDIEGNKPSLIIIENLNRMFQGCDLLGKDIRNLQDFQKWSVDAEIPVVICHHFTKGKQGKRASQGDDYSGDGIIGQVFDSIVELHPTKNGLQLSHKKNRQGIKHESIQLNLEQRSNGEQTYLLPVRATKETATGHSKAPRTPHTASKPRKGLASLLEQIVPYVASKKATTWEDILQFFGQSSNPTQALKRLDAKFPNVFTWDRNKRLTKKTILRLHPEYKNNVGTIPTTSNPVSDPDPEPLIPTREYTELESTVLEQAFKTCQMANDQSTAWDLKLHIQMHHNQVMPMAINDLFKLLESDPRFVVDMDMQVARLAG